MKNNITFIVATKNAIDTIEQCLESIKYYPIILVDKDSTDETLEVAKKFDNVKIVKQKGSGLADAHNIGLKHVKTKYVCIWGADNVLIDKFSLQVSLNLMEGIKWMGCAFQTQIKNPKTYFDKAINIWWSKKFTAGERLVVGTPNCYLTSVLKKYKYDVNCGFCDDSDLGKRLKDDGYKQGYSPYYVYDISKNDLKSIYKRWKIYGISDAQYYKKYSDNWCIKRKIKSWLHPLKTEWIKINLFYLPFYVLIVSIRCFWYYKSLLKG